MAVLEGTFYSSVLAQTVPFIAILPSMSGYEALKLEDRTRFDRTRRFPCLTLLHGYSGNERTWLYSSRISDYAQRCGLAVICPDGNNGHYTDWECGPLNFTYLDQEFLPAMRAMFPLSDRREDNYIGGLSMGGYGAMKWAFTRPETFSYALNFAGGVDIEPRLAYYRSRPETKKSIENVFGDLDRVVGGHNDVFALIRKASAEGRELPKVFTCAGTEDIPGTQGHLKLIQVCREAGVDVTAKETPGEHDFYCWDPLLKWAIEEWLPLKGYQDAAE